MLHVYLTGILFAQVYTNNDNPFGDEHLLDTFVWSKKIEKEGKKHLTTDEIQKLQKLKMRENKVSITWGSLIHPH